MSKGAVIILLTVVCIAIIGSLILLFLNKPFKREDVIVSEIKQLSDMLAIDLTNENIVLKDLKYEQVEDAVNPFSGYATHIYTYFQAKKVYVAEIQTLGPQNSEVGPILASFVAEFFVDNFEFDIANLDYSKSLFKSYSVKQSPTLTMETDYQIFLYVEKARDDEDYVKCFTFTTIPDKVDIDVEKILAE